MNEKIDVAQMNWQNGGPVSFRYVSNRGPQVYQCKVATEIRALKCVSLKKILMKQTLEFEGMNFAVYM